MANIKSRLTQNKINGTTSEKNIKEKQTEEKMPKYTYDPTEKFTKRKREEKEDFIEISSVFNKKPKNDLNANENEAEALPLEKTKIKVSTKVINIILVILCVYVLILIYGVFVTDFVYDKQGEVKPQVMSISDIREKENYEVLLGQYKKCRMLYEQVLIVDYRLSENIEDPLVLAPEYEKLLDGEKNINTKDLDLKTEALSVDPKYSYMKNDLSVWLGTDMATYLRSISAAITKNNPQALEEAIVYRDKLYYDFSKITENMVAVGDNLNGVNISDLKTWTPDGFVEDYKNGKVD